MPRGVFHLLWETLKSGKEFNGYVKNISKDGGFYWVNANLTPSYDDNKNVIGYYSVRRKPRQQALAVIEMIYKEMLAAEKSAGSKQAIEASTKLLLSKLAQQGGDYEEFIHAI